jgi:putative endopeptidase
MGGTIKNINKNINKNNKNNKNKKGKTKKHKTKLNNLSESQRTLICKGSANTYDTFEDKVEDAFKQKGIDFLSTNYNLQKQIIRDLKKAVSPSNINPKNDFYSYINDRWLKDYQLQEGQEYIVQVDDFRIVQDKVYRELIEIIETYLKENKGKQNKKAQNIKNVYESLKKENTNKQNSDLAIKVLEKIDELRKDKSNLWKLLAFYNNNEIITPSCPFTWTINPDDKNPTIYKCYLDPPILSLVDTNVYFDDGTDVNYKNKYKKEYFKYLSKAFELAFGKNHGFNVKDVFDCEVKIINAMICDNIKGDEDLYNLVTKEEALKDFGFNWDIFTKEIGFKSAPKDFVTSNINYLLCGTKMLLEEWSSEQWRTYWIYIFIKQQQRWNLAGRTNFYNFFGKFMRGMETVVPVDLWPIYGMGFCFNTFLTNEYIKKYKNEQMINYVKTMAEDLKTVFIRIIKRNKWLQPKTKEKALQKLYNFNITIGSPEILEEDPLLDYKSDDPWLNLTKFAEWRHNVAIKLAGKPVSDLPVIDWSQVPPKFVGTQAYVVNASYTPSKNGIYIPLGYIQKPFVDLDERGLEYNLARIGFTICHEMSHSLDDWGSKYDEFGRLNNWWTPKDQKKFKKIQEDVIKQYETFALRDGIKFDAEPSIGEDLADISGLTICLEYLRDFQLKNEDILPMQRLSFEALFVYFAVQQRQIIGKKALAAQLKTNPHPLDKYRTNVPLSRMPVFRTIYNIGKKDKMWWHSINRVWED